MPKHEPLTAKAIGKRIKSKGLQKLKFYCQMCQKQCRDQNGFKCHMTSESHQRQLLLFAENPHKYMDSFSSEFLKDFLHLLKRRYSTKRVFANQVYQEYIKDRNHLHMNSTRWVTLTGFCKWMGRKGICHVDHTEKGWFITYIDRDPETLLRQENLAKKEKMAKDDEERQAKIIAEQIERGRKLEEMKQSHATDGDDDSSSQDSDGQKTDKALEAKMFKKESEDQKIVFSIAAKKVVDKKPIDLKLSKPFQSNSDSKVLVKKEEIDSDNEEVQVPMKKVEKSFKKEEPSDSIKRKPSLKESSLDRKKKKSALDEIIEEQERWKAKRAKSGNTSSSNSHNGSYSDRYSQNRRAETWLLPNIVVRVIVRELGDEYHNKKAVVQSVDEYTAIVRMMNSGDLVKVDEQHLETVVPASEGSQVVILRGLYRTQTATIVSLDTKRETVTVRISSQTFGGRRVELPFDDVSKLAS